MKINLILAAFFLLAHQGCIQSMIRSEQLVAREGGSFFEFVSELLKEMVITIKFNCLPESPTDELFNAIRTKNTTQVVTLLQNYPQLLDSAEDSDGVTPLLAATLQGDSALVAHMLSRKPAVDRVAHQGFALVQINDKQEWLPLTGLTPLMAAAKFNQLDIAEKLLRAGARKEALDESFPRKTALIYAQESGNVNMVNLLQ